MRYCDCYEAYENRVEIELVQFGLCFCGEDEQDFVASFGKFVGEVKKCGEMPHRQPWIHHNLELLSAHSSSVNFDANQENIFRREIDRF